MQPTRISCRTAVLSLLVAPLLLGSTCDIPTFPGFEPDLVVTSLTVDSVHPDATDGYNITYSWTIKNVGATPANLDGPTSVDSDNVAVQAYLSADTVFNNGGDVPAGGTILGVSPLGALAPGESRSGSFGCTCVVDVSATPYLTLKVDWGDVVAESDEANNTLAVLIEPPLVQTGVVIDDSSFTITDAEVADAIDYASDLLFQRSGAEMSLQAITHVPSVTGSMQAEIDAYYSAHATDPPHFVIVFSQDSTSVSFGGYLQTSSDLSSAGFCNEFVSPVYGTSRIYGAVIDWTHRFGACGYDIDHYEATGEYLQISKTSLADGSCQNQAGISCVYNSVVGYQVCGDFDPGIPYLEHPKAFIVSIFIHEVLHSFGTNGNLDHFGTATCDTEMGGVSYGAGDLATFQEFAGMCPNVWDTFADSYAMCP